MSWFWIKRGYFGEGRQQLERALASATNAPPALRAWALIGLSHLTAFEVDYVTTEMLLDQSLTLAREAGDMRAVAMITFGFKALVAAEGGDFNRSRSARDGRGPRRCSGELVCPGFDGSAASIMLDVCRRTRGRLRSCR